MTLLETERLLLRPFREDDLDDLAALHVGPEDTGALEAARLSRDLASSEKGTVATK